MKRFLLGTLILVLVSITYAQIEIVREGGVGFHCVDGNDEIISSHAQEYKAIEACQNALLADPDGEYSVISTGRLRLSFNEAHALTVKIFPDETGERNSDNPTGTGTVQSNCLTGYTCADLGTVNACNFDVPDGAGSDKLEINSNVTDGFCWAYKTLSSEDDIHIEAQVLVANANGEDFSGTTPMIVTDGIVWGTDEPVFKCPFFPQIGVARFREEDAAGSATYSATGIDGTSQPYWIGCEYDSATDTVSAWESSNGSAWCQVGVGRVQTMGTGTGYGIASNNGGALNDYTATVDGLVVNNTLSFTEDAGCAGGSTPGTPGGNFVRSNHGYAGGPDWLDGTGQQTGWYNTAYQSWMASGTSYGQMDVYIAWSSEPVDTWADYAHGAKGYNWTTAVQSLPTSTFIVHAYPLTPYNRSGAYSNTNCGNPDLWADITAGDYDTYYEQFAANTRAYQEQNGRSYLNHAIRLGWEMNGNWYPWSVCTQTAAFKTGWARIVNILRTEMPGLVIDFSPARNTNGMSSCDLACFAPDSDYWDVISKSTHDGWYGSTTTIDQNSWEQYHLDNSSDNVVDLTDIDALAAAEDRWMALSEWATQFTDCNSTSFRTSQNQDFFIQKVFDWLDSKKDRIAWAAYFSPSCTALHTRQGDSAAILYKACFADGTC